MSLTVNSYGEWIDDPDAVNIYIPDGMQLYNQIRYTVDDCWESRQIPDEQTEWAWWKLRMMFNVDLNPNSFIEGKNIIAQSQKFIGGFPPYSACLTTLEDAISLLPPTIPSKISGALNIYTKYIDDRTSVKIYLSKRDPDESTSVIWREEVFFLLKEFYITELNYISEDEREGKIEFDLPFSLEIFKDKYREYRLQAEFHVKNGHYIPTPVSDEDKAKQYNFIPSDNFSIEFYSNVGTGSFNFKAYKAQTFGQKLLDKIHSGATFEVPFLQEMEQSENMQLFITSADAIRGIKPTDEQPQGALIKTNFFEFLKNLNYIYSTGQKVNNTESKYDIVRKTDIFDRNNEILNLGKVKNLQALMPELDWFKNNIQVGYEKQEYDYPLGRQEFANTLEFIDDIDIPAQKMELVSKYRADYTGVHLLYYAYVNSDKKDSKSDNDIFFILAFKKSVELIVPRRGANGRVTYIASVGTVVSSTFQLICSIQDTITGITLNITAGRTGVVTDVYVSVGQIITVDTVILNIRTYELQWHAISGKDESGFTINGLDGGGYFNILLSPKHMLKNHAEYFSSVLHKHEKVLRYTSSTETMSDLSITFADATKNVVEKADLSVANAEPFFKPMIFEFDALVGRDLAEALGESPSGYFTFEYNNLLLKGFPIEIEGSLERSEQTVKCIAHPDTPDNIQELLHKRLPNKLYK
ncbi:MAG: hypothetical protein LBJ63_02805 [Prevotellaceae bacterium]|jgi:hypothetical protein|nr:hypothetical protein [Prevotellaceae bacterium]